MKSITIHPQVWKHVTKMYNSLYETNDKLQTVFRVLKLDSVTENVTRSNLEEFFSTLTFDDIFKILKDLLESDNFWLNEFDYIQLANNKVLPRDTLSAMFTRKYVPGREKYWGQELINLLENKNGVVYDRRTRVFTIVGVKDVRILPYTGKKYSYLIDTQFEDYFPKHLVHEINLTFLYGFYTSTMLLARKLIENLLIDLLKDKFPPNKQENKQLYYDESRGRFRFFAEIITSLTSKRTDFIGKEKTIDRLVNKITPFKEQADLNAHSIGIVSQQDDILKHDFKEMIELIEHLKH